MLRPVTAALGVVLVAGGGGAWLAGGGAGESAGTAAAVSSDPPAGSPDTGTTATPAPAPRVPAAPRRVVIPALSVDAPVQPVRAPGGTLVPPNDPQRLGWWAAGAVPGARRGSVLVTGHTVHDGGGALDRLETLDPGDLVTVRTGHGTVRYHVRTVRVFSKGAVASHAERLFSQEVPGRLVLVTCEDWDGERYLSNVVVTAAPVSGRRAR